MAIPTKRGLFCVVEGLDRSGKSTQVQRLVEALQRKGFKAEACRFPGESYFPSCVGWAREGRSGELMRSTRRASFLGTRLLQLLLPPGRALEGNLHCGSSLRFRPWWTKEGAHERPLSDSTAISR